MTFDVYDKKNDYLLTLPDMMELTRKIKNEHPSWADGLYIEAGNVCFLLSQKGKLYIGDDTGHTIEAPERYEARPVTEDELFEQEMEGFFSD